MFSTLKEKKTVIFICAIVCSIWAYLVFSSNILIVHDANNYKDLGQLIKNEGVIGFFKTGPHREPIYPLTTALSMNLGEYWGVN